MSREIVQFKNDMNKLSFKNFTKNDMNLFMAVCAKIKQQNDNIVVLNFDFLRSISGYTATSVETFIKDLKKMSRDVMAVNCEIITGNRIDLFNLFMQFTIDRDNNLLTVKVNPDFTWLLNEFTQGYTTFELQEFVRLQSKYAKTLYRILKQWRSTGQYIFNDIGDFREKMDVPKAYSNMRLMTKIIEPAVKEINKLDKSFINFKCEPLYAKKRGKPLAGYKFTWKPEKPTPNEILVEETKSSESKKELALEEMDKLVDEFGKDIVDDYIKRTKAYKCCTYATIRQWILEDKDRKPRSKNQFNNFMQREMTKEQMDELEHKLLAN